MLITPPYFYPSELVALRAHIAEAVSDPDYSVVISWDETLPDFAELVENALLGPRKRL